MKQSTSYRLNVCMEEGLTGAWPIRKYFMHLNDCSHSSSGFSAGGISTLGNQNIRASLLAVILAALAIGRACLGVCVLCRSLSIFSLRMASIRAFSASSLSLCASAARSAATMEFNGPSSNSASLIGIGGYDDTPSHSWHSSYQRSYSPCASWTNSGVASTPQI